MNDLDIAISGRFLRPDEPTGTHRSALRWLEATAPQLKGMRALVHRPRGKKVTDKLAHCESLRFKNLPAIRPIFDHAWEQTIYPLLSEAKVLWTLMGTGPIFHPGKIHVMFVHDINYILLPEVFSPNFRRWYRLACSKAAQRADVIVCFTDYVRRTLVQRLGLAQEKIRVIPQGPGLEGLTISKLPAPDSPKYFLCVGSLQPHKNLRAVLLAWREFYKTHPEWVLKVVGRAQSQFENLSIDETLLSQSGVQFTGYLSDKDLISLYHNTGGFLYPSIEEGFGLPIVEAFFCGCPVVTSNTSCLPEVAGDAAILIDPQKPEELLQAMELLAENTEERARLRAAGLARARIYEWDRAGAAMAALLGEFTEK